MRTSCLALMTALLPISGIPVYAQEPPTLGKVMFVGDSITHGYGTASYRWEFHKILVDNGISFSVVGVTRDNLVPKLGVTAGTAYAGVPFNNRHSAMSSERAYEIAGRRNESGRLGNSNIFDWLGLDKSYTGQYRINPDTEMPDTFIILIGTNDTFSDFGRKGGIALGANYEIVCRNMFRPGGDMDTIVSAMRQANPAARIQIIALPTWHEGTPHSHTPGDYAALANFNRELKKWAAQQKLPVADVNDGLADVTRSDKPGMGEYQFFSPRDHLHPTPQGDRLIAGALARSMGIGGRTAGLPRKATAELPLRAGTSNYIQLTARENGVTVVLPAPAVGDGETNGWNKSDALKLHLSNSDSATSETLCIKEHGIFWGEKTMLYAGDMSDNREDIRIAWVLGSNVDNRQQGYYVWLGDRLIGEALPGNGTDACKAHLSPPATLSRRHGELHAAPTAYAPAL